MRKTILMLVSCFALASPGQVPCRWTVESSRTAPGQFSCYRGETLSFEPTIKEYGSAMTNYTATLWYQTNGMGTAWWTGTNGMYFTPAMDVGASAYSFYIRAVKTNGISYRANAIVRMLGSPGETPNAIELPVEILDFASITYTNAPWLLAESDPGIPAAVSNAVAQANTNAQAMAAAAQSNAVTYADTNLSYRIFNPTNASEFIDGAGKRYVVSNFWEITFSSVFATESAFPPAQSNYIFTSTAQSYFERPGGSFGPYWSLGYGETYNMGIGFPAGWYVEHYPGGFYNRGWYATTNQYVLDPYLDSGADGTAYVRAYSTTNLLGTLTDGAAVTNLVEALREYHVDTYTNVIWHSVYSNGWMRLVAFTNYPAI